MITIATAEAFINKLKILDQATQHLESVSYTALQKFTPVKTKLITEKFAPWYNEHSS